MGTFFDDTMKGLLEAIAIDTAGAELKEVKDMPAPTYIATEKESELIDRAIEIRKQEKISQQKLAELTGNNQQAISRMESKQHSPSLKLFCRSLNALGYDLQIVKKA